MVERKEFRHNLRDLVEACGLDETQWKEHKKAMGEEFHRRIVENGKVAMSEHVELLDKFFTQRELAMMLGNVVAVNLMEHIKQREADRFNAQMMFG